MISNLYLNFLPHFSLTSLNHCNNFLCWIVLSISTSQSPDRCLHGSFLYEIFVMRSFTRRAFSPPPSSLYSLNVLCFRFLPLNLSDLTFLVKHNLKIKKKDQIATTDDTSKILEFLTKSSGMMKGHRIKD